MESTFFANISFLLLFLAMGFYWIDLAFFDVTKAVSKQAGGTAALFSGVIKEDNFSFKNFLKSTFNNSFSKTLLILANLSLIILLTLRWNESGHFPLSNLYESLMFLSWSCTSIVIYCDFNLSMLPADLSLTSQNQTVQQTTLNINAKNLFLQKVLGAVLAPASLFLNAFATFSLPKEMQLAGPLVPALQSNWLMMHVTVMIVSYAALMLGSLLSIVYLIYTRFFRNLVSANKNTSVSMPLEMLKTLPDNLDYLSYRIIGIGFPFLTIGILSGAVWANEAWGSYWSWDPKETWALLTWFIFAIYLHTRLTKGWEGEKPAIIASCGFIIVWICYLGVNLIGEGLHSYGFLAS